MKADESGELFDIISSVLTETEFHREIRKILSNDNDEDFDLKPNFDHEKTMSFLLVLNRYLMEHGFEITVEVIKQKLRELTEYTLHSYDRKYLTESDIKNYEEFNQFSTVIDVPREGHFDLQALKKSQQKYALFQTRSRLPSLSNIPLRMDLKRKIYEKHQDFVIYLHIDLPEEVQSVNVSTT